MSVYSCLKCSARYDAPTTFCTSCGEFKLICVLGDRPADRAWTSTLDVATAGELLGRSSESLTSSAYPTIVFGPRSLVAIYGAPGSGKSSLLLKLLDGLDAPVLYLSLEEGTGQTLVEKLRRFEIHGHNLHVAYLRNIEELERLLDGKHFDALAVDSLSVSTLQLADLHRISLEKNIPIFFSVHVNKDGDAAGEMSVLHGADLVIRVDKMFWKLEKSRFSPLLIGEV